MNNLERLKLELANKQYFSDDEYSIFLLENDLTPLDEYIKQYNELNLTRTVVAVFEAISNDTDMMMRIQTEMGSTSDAYQWLSQRLLKLKDRIDELQAEEDGEYDEYCPLSLMMTREARTYSPGLLNVYNRRW